MFSKQQEQLMFCSTLSQCKILLCLQVYGGIRIEKLSEFTGVPHDEVQTSLTEMSEWWFVHVSGDYAFYVNAPLDAPPRSPSLTSITSNQVNLIDQQEELTSLTSEKERKKKGKKERKSPPAPLIELVDGFADLNTPAFREAWLEWIEYRKRQLRKPLTEYAAKRQLKKLSPFGPDVAIMALSESMDNQWTGVFPKAAMRINSTREIKTAVIDGVVFLPTAGRNE